MEAFFLYVGSSFYWNVVGHAVEVTGGSGATRHVHTYTRTPDGCPCASVVGFTIPADTAFWRHILHSMQRISVPSQSSLCSFVCMGPTQLQHILSGVLRG